MKILYKKSLHLLDKSFIFNSNNISIYWYFYICNSYTDIIITSFEEPQTQIQRTR